MPFDGLAWREMADLARTQAVRAAQAYLTRRGERVTTLMRPWGFEPLLSSFWPRVLDEAGKSAPVNLGEAFAAARRALERAWGCHNLEVPTSAVCRTQAFARFCRHLLSELERFQE